MKKYLLQIDKEHAEVILKALHLYINIGTGDLEEIMHAFNWHDFNKGALKPWRMRFAEARDGLTRAQAIMGLSKPAHTDVTGKAHLILHGIAEGEVAIDEYQAKTLIRALDFYSRIGIGQFREIVIAFSWWKRDEQWVVHRDDVDRLIQEVQWNLTGMPYNASYGIASPETPEKAKIAYDIKQVIRHRLAWDREPKGGMTVDFDSPMKASEKDFPTIKEEK